VGICKSGQTSRGFVKFPLYIAKSFLDGFKIRINNNKKKKQLSRAI
jgi:hypothetical protein